MACSAQSSMGLRRVGGQDGLGCSHFSVSPSLPPQDLCEVGPCILHPLTLCLTSSGNPFSLLHAPGMVAKDVGFRQAWV